jgi:hypothetical protein
MAHWMELRQVDHLVAKMGRLMDMGKVKGMETEKATRMEMEMEMASGKVMAKVSPLLSL